jgi:hypothetical protein
MGYDLYDFTESLAVAGVEQSRVEHCSLGFGWSPEGYGSWEGGFVCHTRTGKPWLFVFGWCDTTGWGCQDGAYTAEFDREPTRDELRAAWADVLSNHDFDEAIEEADEAPADINRYLTGELDKFGAPVKP